jgi:hypothetical protein
MGEELADKPFQKELVKVTLTNGETVDLPRLTVGKIMVVTDAMSTLITSAKEKSPEIFEIISGKAGDNIGAQLVQTLPQLLPLLLEQIVNVLSLYLVRDAEWIKETMDMEDLVAVATPFFADILKQGNKVMGPLNEALKKAQT